MKRRLAALSLLALLAAAAPAAEVGADRFPLRSRPAGKLDLDIFAPDDAVPLRRRPSSAYGPAPRWYPGDPRDAAEDPAWVRHTSHVGYAAMGAAGLAASLASGGVAPAIGFGLITAVNSYLEYREIKDGDR